MKIIATYVQVKGRRQNRINVTADLDATLMAQGIYASQIERTEMHAQFLAAGFTLEIAAVGR